MFEFNNRVDLQRLVIKLVNSKRFNFELTGLSKPSIERWQKENSGASEHIIDILFKISDKLFFLANKSQEQITSDYKELSSDIHNLIANLRNILQGKV